jgi:leucyl/phenylalanyl-tRNA--protein transferase
MRKPSPIHRLHEIELAFPDPCTADPSGLLAIGGDLSVSRLLLAYRSGIFPWTVNPLTWWSPDPRAIIELDQFCPSRSLDKLMRKKPFTVTLDRAFSRVMEGCAAPAPGRGSTWIRPPFIEAYSRLHEKGHAHSVECWQQNELVGGVYGVSIGGFFAGDSMFHRASNASKIALAHLIAHLRDRRFELFDIQVVTSATRPLGATEISRADYLKRLRAATQKDCSFA